MREFGAETGIQPRQEHAAQSFNWNGDFPVIQHEAIGSYEQGRLVLRIYEEPP